MMKKKRISVAATEIAFWVFPVKNREQRYVDKMSACHFTQVK